MVLRKTSRHLSLLLFTFGASERYPTRTVEHMLAWMILAWSGSLLWPGHLMVGPQYKYLVTVLPEHLWGLGGVVLGALRLVALYLNGNWRRSPGLRFLGAMTGMIWWLILYALYWVAVQRGATDFPMRYVFVVMICFEAYSCYRCGQDHASPKARDAAHAR